MAREAVVAVDFLGLGRSLFERDSTDSSVDKERGKLVKPTASLPASSVRCPGTNSAGEEERESSLSRLMLRTENSVSKSLFTFSLSKQGWPPSGAKEEEVGAVSGNNGTRLEKPCKPLEDLTDTDIMHLTQEDCRDYLNGRGMHRNTWSKPQGQGVMTLRHFESRQEEEKPASRSAGSPQKNGLSDTPTLAASSGPGWQHDTSGPSHTTGSRVNGFQPPRYNVGTTQAAATEDAHGGARPTERGPGPHIDSTSLTLSIPSNREQLPAQSSGFGSPLPTLLRMLKPPDNSLAMHGQRALQGPAFHVGSQQVGSVARSTTQTHLPGRPPTAQLTIFYSGTVNVYDDVPADKAQAIMLLAGSGNTWSSNFMSPPAAVATRPASTGGVASSSSASAGPASTPTPSIPTSSGPGSPLVPSMLVAGGLNKQAAGVATRNILHQAELPQARKASLARFLEKRKDRVRGKGPYMPQSPAPVVRKPEATSPPREKSPSPCTSKVRTRSPSPVNTAPNKKRSPSPAQRPGAAQSSGSETSSPSQRPGTPQKATQPNPSEEQPAASATWRRSKDEQADWGSQQQPQHSKEEKSEPTDEETGSPSQRH